MKKIILASALALSALTGTAVAGDYGHYGSNGRQSEIDRREAIQAQRIEDARRSGELNRREYNHLKQEQARIHEMERRAKADGRIDRYEAAQIRRAQNEASRHIYQESHDSEKSRRYWYRWW